MIFDDWFLPSKDELNAIYTELHLNGVGGFDITGEYSSSSEHAGLPDYDIWYQSFATGFQGPTSKGTPLWVRACRSFTSTTNYNLRDIGPAGGRIFWKSGNDYLEAAPSDQSVSHTWSNANGLIAGTGTAIGTGQANTAAIIEQVSLGSELIDQDLWADVGLAYYDYASGSWSGDNVKLTCIGGDWSPVTKLNFWEIGKTYRVVFEINRISGTFSINDGVGSDCMADSSGIHTFDFLCGGTELRVDSGSLFVGDVLNLSIKEILGQSTDSAAKLCADLIINAQDERIDLYYSNGNIPTYRFYISEASSVSYEVFPLKFLSTSLVDEQESDQIFYRRKFAGSLLFGTNSLVIDDSGVTQNRKDDWLLLWGIEQNDPCERLFFTITKTVAGVMTTYWEGHFSTTDGKFDLDKCTFEVTPMTDDDYTDLLSEVDTQYNILIVYPVVSTHAYLVGFVDVNYTHNRWLVRPGAAPVLSHDNVIWYLADQMITGIIVSSHFFTDATNYVTKEVNHLLYLTIAQKSDIIRPTSTDPATAAMMSWSELMDILWVMFQVKWNYNPITNTINVEHISWWTKGVGIDLRTQLACVATNKYSYTKEKMPKHERFAFMEADNPDFIGVPIYYDSACVDQNPDTNNKESSVNVTTDLEYIVNNPDAISDDGFVILCNDATNHVEAEGGAYIGYWKLNMHLSWANLHHRYFRYNRILIHGYMNEVDTPFWTAQKTKKQLCSAIICNDFDPTEEITTELGETYFSGAKGIVNQAEISPAGSIKLELLYGPADNATAIAAGVPDFVGGVPEDPVAIAANYINPTYFSAEWNWVVDGTVAGYLLDVSVDLGFGTFVGIYHDLDVGFVDEWEVTGLTTGTLYHYRLRAYNEGGISGYSNIIDVTTT